MDGNAVYQDLPWTICLVSQLDGSILPRNDCLDTRVSPWYLRPMMEPMGTASDWMSVAFSAIFWGGWMLLWRSDAHMKRGLSLLYVLGLALASLWFGLVVTFHWRAFYWPLILLTGTSLVGAVVVGRSARRRIRSSE